MRPCYDLSRRQWQWIWERYCEGYTLKELASFLGVNAETIRRRFRRMGLRAETRQELLRLSERRKEFCALWEED